MVPSQLNSHLGFINPGLTLWNLWMDDITIIVHDTMFNGWYMMILYAGCYMFLMDDIIMIWVYIIHVSCRWSCLLTVCFPPFPKTLMIRSAPRQPFWRKNVSDWFALCLDLRPRPTDVVSVLKQMGRSDGYRAKKVEGFYGDDCIATYCNISQHMATYDIHE